MSATGVSFEIKSREKAGTGPSRAIRRDGAVPAVVYGGDKAPKSITIDPKPLLKEATTAAFFSRLYTLVDGKNSEQVIAKAIQWHPVTDAPLHVDFMRISKDSKVHVQVPLQFINEDKSPGIKRGGTLNVIIHNLELICPPQSIPQSLVVDLTGLEMGQSLIADHLNLDKGVKLAHAERDNVLATIVAPSGGTASEEAAPSEG